MAKSQPTKIALVYDAIYPFVMGGGERRFYEMGKRLAAMGYEVHWYGMKFWDGPSTREHDGIVLHGICKARPLYTKDGRRSIAQAIIFGLASFKLLVADYDVIDCCGFPYFSLFPAKLSALMKRKPLLATWHEVWGKKYWREYLGTLGIVGYWVEMLATKLPNVLIANSQHTADALQANFHPNKVVVVPNGIDVQMIAKLPVAKQSADIVYVGRVVDFKNIHLIIEALSKLKKEGSELSCQIIGDGPAKKELQKLAQKLGVAKQICWHGFIEKSEDVYSLVKASKLFVLPSEREGFGIVAIEANACGVPVLTADFPANAAKDLILAGKNGYIFKPQSTELATFIQKALKRSDKLQQSSRQSANEYDWLILAKKQVEAYSL